MSGMNPATTSRISSGDLKKKVRPQFPGFALVRVLKILAKIAILGFSGRNEVANIASDCKGSGPVVYLIGGRQAFTSIE